MTDYTHKPLRGKDYAAARATESYAVPTPARQKDALLAAIAKARSGAKLFRRVNPGLQKAR